MRSRQSIKKVFQPLETFWLIFPILGTFFGTLAAPAQTVDDALFIHHSCGQNWLSDGLEAALQGKAYVDEVNDITYGTDLTPDAGRPDSLADTPGDHTDMCHWIFWFNDYVQRVKTHGCASGANRIILFKSCYPASNVSGAGTEPGDPFSAEQTLANYRAVYRHPTGGVYTNGGQVYQALEEVFASNPDILFIPVTAPPRHYTGSTDAEGQRVRQFNNWLKNEWSTNYAARHPGLNNVAVYDWFDLLAYADDHPTHPNRLRAEFGGATSDSHPNYTANATSTWFFAIAPSNFLDQAWLLFDPDSRLDLMRLRAVALTNSVILRWPDPRACGFTGATVQVRFGTTAHPTNHTEGERVYEGEAQEAAHTNLTPGQTYWYTVWPVEVIP